MERGGKISVEVLEEGQKDGHLEEERIEMGRKEGMGERQGERRGERQKKNKIGHQGDARETEEN